MLISIDEYARLHNKATSSVRQKAGRGGFLTARKIAGVWLIDNDEPYIDGRIKSRKYLDWRNKTEEEQPE